MSSFVADASIAVKWFLPEEHSDAASRLLGSEVSLSAPDLLLTEVANAVWKRVHRGDVDGERGLEILSELGRMPVRLVPAAALLPDAYRIACTYQRTVYDSLYLALAARSGLQFVTADRKLYTAIARSDLKKHLIWIADTLAVGGVGDE